MSTPRLIYYYQTFKTLRPVLDDPNCCGVTHIHVSAFHFGTNPDNTPYIHMNNYPPTDKRFDGVWKELEEAHEKGIKIVLMLGGAGSAYQVMFSDYDTYYGLLKDTLYQFPIIDGIDLDIEKDNYMCFGQQSMNSPAASLQYLIDGTSISINKTSGETLAVNTTEQTNAESTPENPDEIQKEDEVTEVRQAHAEGKSS